MIKIFFLLMIMSTPNQKTVMFNGSIFPTEELCIVAKESYMEAFEARSVEYKRGMKTKAFCIPFDSFTIIGMPSPMGA